MPNLFEQLANMPRARLNRRLVVWVFVAVLVIEGIILIPSYQNRRQELLEQLKAISAAKVAVLSQVAGFDRTETDLLVLCSQKLVGKTILGGQLYLSDGRPLGTFGKNPPMAPAAQKPSLVSDFLDKKSYRYDAVLQLENGSSRYKLVVRHDAGVVKKKLSAFIWRIIGLTVIISIFVTVATWLALNPLVVKPILDLRLDLINTGRAVEADRKPDDFQSIKNQRHDELGDVISAFQRMFDQIQEAITKRKRAEQSLQASLHQVEAVSSALNEELKKGHQIQHDFLPKEFPALKGWEIGAAFFPARQVSGDFYDVFELPGGYIGLVIGDVSDKGVGAALYMALIRSLIRIFSGHYRAVSHISEACRVCDKHGGELLDRNDILQAVDLTSNYIIEEHGDEGMFASLFFGVLCPKRGELMYVNAGHEPLFVIRVDQDVKRLSATGPAIGVAPDYQYKTETFNIKPGDTLIGYTDGVTEAQSIDRTFFTRSRLKQLLVKKPVESTDRLLNDIKSALYQFVGDADQADDIALLAVRRTKD